MQVHDELVKYSAELDSESRKAAADYGESDDGMLEVPLVAEVGGDELGRGALRGITMIYLEFLNNDKPLNPVPNYCKLTKIVLYLM